MKSKSVRLTDEQLIQFLINNYETKYQCKYTSFNAFVTYLIQVGICSLNNIELYKDDTLVLLSEVIETLKVINDTNLKLHEENKTLDYTLFNLFLNFSQGKYFTEDEVNKGMFSSRPKVLDKDKNDD